MIIESLMTHDPEACRPESTLADAAAIMWRRDCGVVPVTDDEGKVVGMITDRDICMALATSGRHASEARVGEVMSREVRTCTPVDDVREALEALSTGRLRRLPVVNSLGKLVGILSISDVILHTRKSKGKKHVSRRDTLATLRAICRPLDPARSVEGDEDDSDEDSVGTNEIDGAATSEAAGLDIEDVLLPETKKARARSGKSKAAGKHKRAGKGKSKSAGEGESGVVDKSEGVIDGGGDVTG